MILRRGGGVRLAYVRFGHWPEFLAGREFNFLDHTRFSLDLAEKKLTIKDGDRLPILFFPENITAVSVLVGPNGSGKSTLLRNLAIDRHADTSSPAGEDIFIFEEESDDGAVKFCLYGFHSKIEFIDQRTADRKPIHQISKAGGNVWGQIEAAVNSTFIYYSYSFDTSVHFTHTYATDISTSYFVLADKEKRSNSFDPHVGQVLSHRHSEILRKAKFIFENPTVEFGFPIPENLTFSLDTVAEDEFYRIGNEEIDENEFLLDPFGLDRQKFASECSGLIEMFRRQFDSIPNAIRFSDHLLRASLNQVWISIYDSFDSNGLFCGQEYVSTLKQLFRSQFKIFPNSLIEAVSLTKERILKKQLMLVQVSGLDDIMKMVSNLVGLIESIPKSGAEGEIIRSDFDIPVQKEAAAEVLSFIEKYQLFSGIRDFGRFDFRGLSSGEDSMLTIYSRLYWLKHHRALNSNLIFCLDEGDSFFHPEWQRKYFGLLSRFISATFSEANSIQLLFATHSPFLLSDLPRQCVVFMGPLAMEEQTFGANIHSLLANGMFLKSTIGEFAESKVNWIIGKLNYDNLPESDFPLLQQYIDLIGEPIIQKELQRMLNEKQEMDPRWIKAEIERLQKLLPNNGGQK